MRNSRSILLLLCVALCYAQQDYILTSSIQLGASTSDDRTQCIVRDSQNNIIFGGNFQGDTNFGGSTLSSLNNQAAFLAKYNSSNAHQWSKSFAGDTTAGQLDSTEGVAVDSAGKVIAVGFFQGTISFDGNTKTSAGGPDAFIVQYDSSGGYQWSMSWGALGPDS